MVKGLNLFKEHFRQHSHRYVLIGGTAAALEMDAVGETFRATRDLDIVLLVEARDALFGAIFWEFLEKGGYERREVSERPQFYRFSRPANTDYPAMLELFARAPTEMVLDAGQRVVPIPLGEALASLSALLLDDDYYQVVMETSRNVDGLSWMGTHGLIPLKAKAWLDLKARRAQLPGSVDAKHIGKHFRDVLRLSQTLSPGDRVTVPRPVRRDLRLFIDKGRQENIDETFFGERLEAMLDRIGSIYV